MKVFINYRREDTAGDARALYDRLARQFGRDDVCFDINLEPGLDWMRAIRAEGERAGGFLALIGPRWVSSLRGWRAAGVVEPVEDLVLRDRMGAPRSGPAS